jgi:hypothetical protein
MIISHKESSKRQTNSILNSYYNDTLEDYDSLIEKNSNLVTYQDNVLKSISKLNTALYNYYKAAKYMYMLEKRLADVLGIQLDWSQLSFASTYQEVIDYDLNN